MWSLAFKTLIADRGKLFTALVGVVFSIVLVNLQGGLFLGLIRKASMLVDHGQADIWVGHKKMHNVDFPQDIPKRWIHRIQGIPGVKRVEPYLVGYAYMTLPNGGFEGVFVVGVDEASLMGNAWNLVEGRAEYILKNDGIIVDRLEDAKLDHPEIGSIREIGGHRARIVAKSDGVMGFLVNPYVFTTYHRAASYMHKPHNASSYFLVQLEEGAKVRDVCAAIKQRIPDVEAYTRTEYSTISVNYWMTRTGIGISFGAATLLGLFVGLVMVAQTLYAMVLDRLTEFGTLKAIGANERQIYSLLFFHSIAMATVGSILGLAIVCLVQTRFSTPRAPILIPYWLSVGSCLLVTAICLVSSLLPYLRIRKIDPLMVLQG